MNDTAVSSRRADPPADAAVRSSSAPALPVAGQDAVEEVVIRPRPGWIAVDWKELWRYRELLYFLVWRDVKIRYKQTVLGAAWAILQPVFYMVIFTIFFGNYAGIKETLHPALQDAYPIFVYAGLLPWMFIANAVQQGGLSLVNQQHLLTKIYLPRLFVPSASVGGGLVDLLLSFVVFAGLMLWYQPPLSWGVLVVPLLVLLTMMVAMGVAYTLSALTVTYRDFRFVIPFLVQAWMFLSPVIYPRTIVPARFEWIMALNPMTGIIDGFRSAFFGSEIAPWNLRNLAISTAVTVALLLFGMFYFRKTERRFADIA